MTPTSEGRIPYRIYNGYLVCVKVDMTGSKDRDRLYPPLKRDGKMVYALPGGREICL